MFSARNSFPSRPPAVFKALRLSAIALGLGLVVSACGDTRPSTVRTARAPTVVLQRTLDTMLRAPGEGAAEAFLDSLPQPVSTTRKTVTNPYDPSSQDEVETVVFDGLSILVYHVGATGASFPVAVSVTSPAYHTSAGLRVGLRRAEVRAALGTPASGRQDGSWHYDRSEAGAAPYSLDVTFDGDRVAALRWTAYLD